MDALFCQHCSLPHEMTFDPSSILAVDLCDTVVSFGWLLNFGAHDHKVGISIRRRQNLDYLIDPLTLIHSISSTFQLAIPQLDEARISENCKGEEDGGYRSPASGIDFTQFRSATQGRWFFRLVGFLHHGFSPHHFEHLEPSPTTSYQVTLWQG